MIKLIETAAALLCQPRPTKAVPYSMYSMLHTACVCQGSMRSNELSYDKLIPGPGQCAAAHRWPALIGCSSRSFYYWSHKAHSVQSHIPAVHTWQHNMQTDHSDSHPPAPSVALASWHLLCQERTKQRLRRRHSTVTSHYKSIKRCDKL